MALEPYLFSDCHCTMKISSILIAVILVTSCAEQRPLEFDDKLKASEHSLLMFFAPDCPLCITFSKPINELHDSFPDVQFLAVLSGSHYSKAEVEHYFEQTGLKAELIMDPDYRIAKSFAASITPEFFLIDKEANILYQGLLDDRMESVGVYRKVWNNYFLKDALESNMYGRDIYPTRTDAIGCVLEY